MERTPNPGFTPLYKLCRYVSPHRVAFLRRFGLKTGIYFAHFGLESRVLSERMKVFIVSIPNEQERKKYANSKCIWRIFLFAHWIEEMMTWFLPNGQVWKRVWILEVWSENGSVKLNFFGLKWGKDLENHAARPHQEFLEVRSPGIPKWCSHSG